MKKGFTLVELLGVIVVITILGTLAVVSVNYLVNNGKQGVYENYETTLKGAAENYLINHMDEVPNQNASITKTLDELVASNEIERLKDPNGGDCDSSYVVISRGNDVSGNFNLSYKVCLICDNYQSDGC